MGNKIVTPKLDQKTHVYTGDEGETIPSVTQILASLGIIPTMPDMERIREAANRGSAVHKVLELLTGECDDVPKAYKWWVNDSGIVVPFSEVKEYAEAGLSYLLDTNTTVKITETALSGYGYAGTVDCICERDERVLLVDWKTTAKISESTYMQIAAYKKLFCVDHGEVVQLKSDGTYEVYTCPDVYSERWIRCLEIYFDNDIPDKQKKIEARKIFREEITLPPMLAQKLVSAVAAEKEATQEKKDIEARIQRILSLNGINRNGQHVDKNGSGFAYTYNEAIDKTAVDYKQVVDYLNTMLWHCHSDKMYKPAELKGILERVIERETSTKTKAGFYKRQNLGKKK